MSDKITLHDFYNIRVYDPIENKAKSNKINNAYEFVKEEVFSKQEEIRNLENKLLYLSKKDKDKIESFLCLRCKVSHLIFRSINKKLQKFSFNNKPLGFYSELTRELFPNALQDNGHKYLKLNLSEELVNLSEEFESKLPKDLKNIIEKKRIPINWKLKEIKEKIDEFNKLMKEFNHKSKNESNNKSRNKSKNFESISLPLGIEIVFSFNNKLAGLATWADQKFTTNKEVKKILEENGFDSLTIWLKLTKISLSKLKDAWRYKLNSDLPPELERLLVSYKIEYKKAKSKYIIKNRRSYGWMPDETFLKSLDPPQKDYENLRLINQVYSWYMKYRETIESNNPDNNTSIPFEIDLIEVNRFIAKNLKEDLQEIVNRKFEKLKPDFLKNPFKMKILKLWCQGKSQRNIAEILSIPQTTVFRFLKGLDPFLKDVCLEVIPRFEKKLNLLYKNKNYLHNSFLEFHLDKPLDEETLIDTIKELLELIKNSKTDIKYIEYLNEYCYKLLTRPNSNVEIKNKKNSITFFQELVIEYLKNE